MRYFSVEGHYAQPEIMWAVDSLEEAIAQNDSFYSEDQMRSHPDLLAALERWDAGDRLSYMRARLGLLGGCSQPSPLS